MEKKRQEEYNRLEMSTIQEDAERRRMNAYKPGRGEQEENEQQEDNDQENRAGA